MTHCNLNSYDKWNKLAESPISFPIPDFSAEENLLHANKTALYSSMKWGSLRSTWTGKCTVVNIAAQT